METIRFLQRAASPTLDTVALLVTNLGMELSYIALLLLAFHILPGGRGRRLGVYFLSGYYLNELLKGIFDTPRPYQLDAAVLRSEAARKTGTGAGFPSGHAQGATMFWGLAAYYVGRWIFTLLAVLLIAAISLSRLYLGVHLPIDVVGGVAIGLVVVLIALILDRFAWRPDEAWVTVLGIGIPLVLHLTRPTADSHLILGGLAALLTAPEPKWATARRPLRRRVLISLVGLILVFAALLGSSELLPEAVKRHPIGGFMRYLVLAYIGLLLPPLLVRRLSNRRA